MARNRLLKYALEKNFKDRKDLNILDLASACGDNYPICNEYGTMIGIDLSDISLKICKEKGLQSMVKGDVQVLPIKSKTVDVVIAFDIFEHLPEDEESMREVMRVLKDSGLLLVNVPAFMCLFSGHDEAFEHVRRYTSKEMKRKLKSAGFNVIKSSYWSFFLFPAVFLNRKLLARQKNNEEKKSDFHLKLPRVIEYVFSLIADIEHALMVRGLVFPWGVSLFCVARKDIKNLEYKE